MGKIVESWKYLVHLPSSLFFHFKSIGCSFIFGGVLLGDSREGAQLGFARRNLDIIKGSLTLNIKIGN